MDDRLAACDVGQLFSLPRVGPDDGAKEAARLPGFTAELVGQQDGLIAKLPAGGSGGGAKLPHTAGDPGRHVVQHLGSFLRQKSFCLFRELQVILLRNGKRLCAGRGVRHRRAAGDHIQRVAQNIAQHNAEHLSRGACLREPPALDARKPFADGVHLHDVGTAGKKLAGDVLQFCTGEQRLFKQCTSSAGEQKQHGILRCQPLHQLQCLLGGRKAVLVRHRMARFITIYAQDLALDMLVFGHDHAAVHTAQRFHRRVCHLPCGLARCDQQHPAALGRKGFQCAADSFVRQDGVQAGCDDGIGILSQSQIHETDLLVGYDLQQTGFGHGFYKAPLGRAVQNHYTARPAFREYFRQWF